MAGASSGAWPPRLALTILSFGEFYLVSGLATSALQPGVIGDLETLRSVQADPASELKVRDAAVLEPRVPVVEQSPRARLMI